MIAEHNTDFNNNSDDQQLRHYPLTSTSSSASGGSSNRRKQFRPARVGAGDSGTPQPQQQTAAMLMAMNHLNGGDHEQQAIEHFANNSSLSPPLSSPSSSPGHATTNNNNNQNLNNKTSPSFVLPLDFTEQASKSLQNSSSKPIIATSALDLSVTSSSKSPASSISGKMTPSHLAQTAQQTPSQSLLAPFVLDSAISAMLMNGGNINNGASGAGNLEQGQVGPQSSSSSTTTVDFCPYCKKSFCNKYYLRKHLKDIHRLELPRPPRGQALDISASTASTSTGVVDSVLQSTPSSQVSPPIPANSPISAAIQQFLSPPPENSSSLSTKQGLGSTPLLPWMEVASAAAAAAAAAASNSSPTQTKTAEISGNNQNVINSQSLKSTTDEILALLAKTANQANNSKQQLEQTNNNNNGNLRLPGGLNLANFGFNFANFASAFANNNQTTAGTQSTTTANSSSSSSSAANNLLRELAAAAGLSMSQQLLLDPSTGSSAGSRDSTSDLLTKRLLSQQAAFEAAAKLVSAAAASASKQPNSSAQPGQSSANSSTTANSSGSQQVQISNQPQSGHQNGTQKGQHQTSGNSSSGINGVISSNNSGGGGGSSSSNITERVECDICHKLVCNKYFLRAHKFKIHHIRDPRLPPKWARIAAEMDRQAAASVASGNNIITTPPQTNDQPELLQIAAGEQSQHLRSVSTSSSSTSSLSPNVGYLNNNSSTNQHELPLYSPLLGPSSALIPNKQNEQPLALHKTPSFSSKPEENKPPPELMEIEAVSAVSAIAAEKEGAESRSNNNNGRISRVMNSHYNNNNDNNHHRRRSSSISSLLALAMKKMQQKRHLASGNVRLLTAASNKSIVLAKARHLAKIMCRSRLSENNGGNGSFYRAQQHQEFFVEASDNGGVDSLLALPATLRLPVCESVSSPIVVQLRLVPKTPARTVVVSINGEVAGATDATAAADEETTGSFDDEDEGELMQIEEK